MKKSIKNYMKKSVAAVLSAALSVMLMTGCGSSAPTSTSSNANVSVENTKTPAADNTAEELTNVKLAINPFIGLAPVYTGVERGIFKKYGLNVEIVNFDDPSQATAALISGNVDIAGGTMDSTLIIDDQYRDNMPKIIGITDNSAGADGIVAKTGIESIEDLKGKTVGVAVNQTTHFLLKQALEEANVDESELELVDMSSSDAGASFISGQIDAAVTWEPYLSNASKSGVGKMIFSSADIPGVITDVLVVSAETAESKPEWVTSFLMAVNEAKEYVENTETTADAMEASAGYLEVSPEEAAEMLPTVKLYSPEETAEALAAGGTAYEMVGKISDFYTDKGIMSDKVSADEAIDTDFINEIK